METVPLLDGLQIQRKIWMLLIDKPPHGRLQRPCGVSLYCDVRAVIPAPEQDRRSDADRRFHDCLGQLPKGLYCVDQNRRDRQDRERNDRGHHTRSDNRDTDDQDRNAGDDAKHSPELDGNFLRNGKPRA